ncbi:hypothetical protein C5B97_08475 [Pseudoclavibacter sp. RFBB5]|nr:hypothetical protein C5B97_08475 [Pseudoclavibacter sp. RFBB5]
MHLHAAPESDLEQALLVRAVDDGTGGCRDDSAIALGAARKAIRSVRGLRHIVERDADGAARGETLEPLSRPLGRATPQAVGEVDVRELRRDEPVRAAVGHGGVELRDGRRDGAGVLVDTVGLVVAVQEQRRGVHAALNVSIVAPCLANPAATASGCSAYHSR